MSWSSMQTKAAAGLLARYALFSARIDSPPPPQFVNSLGHPNTPATPYATDWQCAIEPTTGQEEWIAARTQGLVTHILTGPFIAGVTPNMTVAVAGRTFAIKFVNDVNNAGQLLQLVCVEKV